MTPIRRALSLSAALLAASALGMALSACQPRASGAASQVVDGYRFDYGMAPAEVVQAHPADHPEPTMHRGPIPGSYHVTLAVFDAKTGARIDDARAQLDLSGPGHPGHVTMPLESMTINGTATYGGYVVLPSAAKYRLTFEVTRPGQGHIPRQGAFHLRPAMTRPA